MTASFLAIDGLFNISQLVEIPRIYPLVKSNMPETCRNLLQNIDFFGGSSVDIVISNLIHAQCGAVDDMNEFICLPFSPLKKKTFNHGGHRFRLVRITQQNWKNQRNITYCRLKKKTSVVEEFNYSQN